MHNRDRSRDREVPTPALVGVLLAGILLFFPVSPAPTRFDLADILLPLGIVGALIVSVVLIQYHDASAHLETEFGRFGWLGALVGGLVGVWLAGTHLSHGMPLPQAYDEVLTVLSIAIGAGALVGISTGLTRGSVSRRQDGREDVLAESAWTNRSGPSPIMMEIIEQLADLEQVDPTELEPLVNHINVDVFEVLRAGGNQLWQLHFNTDDYEIRVSSQGTITVYDIPRADAGPATSPTSSTP